MRKLPPPVTDQAELVTAGDWLRQIVSALVYFGWLAIGAAGWYFLGHNFLFGVGWGFVAFVLVYRLHYGYWVFEDL